MLNSRLKIKTEVFFMLAYDMFLVQGIISTSLLAGLAYGITQKVLVVIEILMLIYVELRNKKIKQSEMWMAVTCLGLFFLCYMRNPIELAVMYLFIFSARKFSFKRIAQHTCVITLVLLFVVVGLSQIGMIRDIVFEGYRHALGFRYVLFPASLFLNVVLLLAYLSRNYMSCIELTLLALGNTYLLLNCHSGLSSGLTYIALVYLVICRLNTYFKQKISLLTIKPIFKYVFLLCIICSIIVVFLYNKDPSKFAYFDKLISGRLALTVLAFSDNAVSLFGNTINWIGNGVDQFGNSYLSSSDVYYYVDNAYFNVLLEQGVIYFISIWGLYSVGTVKLYKNKDNFLFAILVIIAVYFLIDNLKLRLIYNTFWIVIVKSVLGFPMNSNLKSVKKQ